MRSLRHVLRKDQQLPSDRPSIYRMLRVALRRERVPRRNLDSMAAHSASEDAWVGYGA